LGKSIHRRTPLLNYSGSAIAELSTSYLHPTITMNSIPLEVSFSVECLKRHLHKYPEQAPQLATNHYEDFLLLAHKYKKLEQKNYALLSELSLLLQHQQQAPSPQLPNFLANE
jgi:aminopeptidase-like protein